MAADTYTATPAASGSGPMSAWSFSGDVALDGAVARLSYDRVWWCADDPAADFDLGSEATGTDVTNWTGVNATLRRGLDGATPVAALSSGGWGGAYYDAASFVDHAVKTTIHNTASRYNPVVGYNPVSTSGAAVQVEGTTAAYISTGVPTNFIATTDTNINYTRQQWSGVSNKESPDTSGDSMLFNFHDSAGDEEFYTLWGKNEALFMELVDTYRRYGGGRPGLQTFVWANYQKIEVFQPATGTAEVTLTPNTVTTWSKITASKLWVERAGRVSGLSGWLEYKMTGSGASPSAFTAVPDNGDISAAVGDAIVLRATLKNDFKQDQEVDLYGLAVEIDGTWVSAVGVTPGVPTSFSATAISQKEIRLTWTDGANTVLVKVYGGDTNVFGDASLIGAVPAATQTFTETGLAAATTRYYWLVPVSDTPLNGPTAGSVTATTHSATAYDITPDANKHDVAEDLVKHFVAEIIKSDGSANFTEGVTFDSQESGTLCLTAGFLADKPDDAGYIIANEADPEEQAPVKAAEVQVTLRTASLQDGTAGRSRALSAAWTVYRFLRPNGQVRVMETLPSGRVVIVFEDVRIDPQGRDKQGRDIVVVSFRMEFRERDVS